MRALQVTNGPKGLNLGGRVGMRGARGPLLTSISMRLSKSWRPGVEKPDHRLDDSGILAFFEAREDVDLLLWVALVFGIHLREELEQRSGDLFFALKLFEDLEGPRERIAGLEEVVDWADRRIAMLHNPLKRGVLLLAIGDARIDPDREARQQRA